MQLTPRDRLWWAHVDRLTLVSRGPSGWTTQDFVSGQRVALTEPAVSLTVDQLYAGIALDPA